MQKRVVRAGIHPRYVKVIFICQTRGKGTAPGSAGTRVGGQGLCLAFPFPKWLQPALLGASLPWWPPSHEACSCSGTSVTPQAALTAVGCGSKTTGPSHR